MQKQALLGTGMNGLVGSKFKQLFQTKYSFASLDIRDKTNPVDITQADQVMQAVAISDAKALIHLAAFTNVNAAWEQNGDKNGLCYQVNVNGTKNIIDACQAHDKHLIHISTAYVFDGEKQGLYTEEDNAHPIEWYGQTKWEAEQLVMNSDINWTILRIDQPFRLDPFEKTDIAHRIMQGLKDNSLHPMFTNHWFGPTFIEDFAKVLDYFVRTGSTGLFHATSGEKWTDYEFATAIKQALELPGEVKRGNLADYLAALERPYQKNTALDNSKLEQVLDFELKEIDAVISGLQF